MRFMHYFLSVPEKPDDKGLGSPEVAEENPEDKPEVKPEDTMQYEFILYCGTFLTRLCCCCCRVDEVDEVMVVRNAAEADALKRLELYVALCTREPPMLPLLFQVFVDSKPFVRVQIHKQVRTIIYHSKLIPILILND